MNRFPEFRDIEAAAERLRGLATVTPLLENADLNARTGGRILLKAETLQRTGSFKFRGAFIDGHCKRIEPATAEAAKPATATSNSANGSSQPSAEPEATSGAIAAK